MIVRKFDAPVPVQGRPPKHDQIEKRAYRINEFCSAYGLGRTKVYELIKSGKSVLCWSTAADLCLGTPATLSLLLVRMCHETPAT